MRAGRAYNEFSDDLSDEDYFRMLDGALANALAVSDDAMFNIGILAGSKRGVVDLLAAHKAEFCDVLVWAKDKAMALGLPSQRGLVSHICELVFCFNHKGNRSFSHPQWPIGNMTNRIDTRNNSEGEYSKEHAAAFPVEFPAYVIRNFTESSVLDLFGGTGTTMIAAEQLGRRCYMMEIDPSYCDLIIERWERFTGLDARKES